MPAAPSLKQPRIPEITGVLDPDDWTQTARRVKGTLDPLSEWKERFQEFIETFAQFREMEDELFFAHHGLEPVKRMHRGWLCNLIGNAEHLAVALMTTEAKAADKATNLRHLDAFIDNLVATFDTWHTRCFEEQEEPAAA